MLVLSRKTGEKIMIGDDIMIVVQRIASGRVAIAIEAPRDVKILRGELERFSNGVPPTNGSSSAMPESARSFDPLRDTPVAS